MPFGFSVAALACAALLFVAQGGAAESRPAGRCVDQYGPGAEWGTVFENRAAGTGRRIDIYFIVLRASGWPSAEPLFLLAGGPGQPASTLLPIARGFLKPAREHRDIVLVDQRGTGRSNPLRCPVDLDAVRSQLGYPRILLWAGSYGTRLAQVYMRLFHDRVTAAVLDGVVPVDVGVVGQYAKSLQRALDLVLEWFRIEAKCVRTYPTLAEDLAGLVKQFHDGGLPAVVTTRLGRRVPVSMSLGDFAYAVRGILYKAAGSQDLPAMIHRAAISGDASEFAQRYWDRVAEFEAAGFADMLHLANMCVEDVAVIRVQDIPALASGTLMGRYLIDEYRGACAALGRTTARMATPAAAVSVPTLLVSGHLDPATPPEFAARAAKSLPRSRQIVATTAAHGASGDCARDAVLHVLIRGTLDGLPRVCGASR